MIIPPGVPAVRTVAIGGPPGPTGVPGQSAIQRVAAAAMSAGQVVRTHAAGQQMQAATTDLRTRPFDAILLGDIGSGATGNFHVAGPVPANVVQLGAGYACAVGTDATGALVRATDPTCVSAPNWAGDCDVNGNYTHNPRRAAKFYARDFGLVPDGVTPCDAPFEAMRIVMNNSPHNVVEFDEGIYRFNATIGGTGTSAWPFGTIFQGQGVSDLFRPDPNGGAYALKSGTVIACYGSGAGLHIGYSDSGNYGNGGAVRDIEFQGHLTTGWADYPNINEIGIELLGDTSITIERVRCTGFQYGVSVDGAEVIFIRDMFFDGAGGANGYQNMLTDLGDNSAASIRIGSFKFTVGGSANAVYVTGAQFNSARYGVWHKDGVGHVVRDCNFEIPSWALIHAPVCVAYENCEGEGETVASFHGKITSEASASAFNLTIRNCFFGGHFPALKLENVSIGGLVIEGNNFSNFGSTEIIQQLGFAHVVSPILWGGNALPGTGVNGFGLAGTGASLAGSPGTTLNDILSPAAACDVAIPDLSIPALRLYQGARTFAGEGHTVALGGHHYRFFQVYNPNTTRIGGYRGEYLECVNVASGSSTHDLGAAVSPSQGGGRVQIEVDGVVEADRTRLGSWIVWQHYKDDGGGPSLLGSPTTTLASTTDASLLAPTIEIVGGKFYARITEHASQVTDWSASVKVYQAGA